MLLCIQRQHMMSLNEDGVQTVVVDKKRLAVLLLFIEDLGICRDTARQDGGRRAKETLPVLGARMAHAEDHRATNTVDVGYTYLDATA